MEKTKKEIVVEFLSHPFINIAQVAGALYGSVNTSNTAKLRNKLSEAQNKRLLDSEIEKLFEIIENFKKK